MRKICIAALVLLLLIGVFGCQPKETEPPANPEPGNGSQVPAPEPPEEEPTEVTLYYMNEAYILSGDESLEKTLPVTRQVALEGRNVEAVVLEELKKEPEEAELLTVLEGITILSVETRDGTANVDLSGENLSGGSLQEYAVLAQIVLSLTELPEVERVQFYVDGSIRETLMSHYTTKEPFIRADFQDAL